MRDETIAIHTGYESEATTKASAVPIYQTVAYEFDDAQHGADLFNLAVPGNIYTRIMNPTQDVLEQRVAALEGGVAGLATSAGMAAINYALLNLASQGDNIVSVPMVYGGTYTLFAHMLPSQGIDVRFGADDSVEALAALVDENTKAIFLESVGNPAGNIPDIEAIATMAHEHGVPLIVDNTVPSPVLCKPIEWGADVVVHAMTKYIGGHGTSIGGMIVDAGTFDWVAHAERFPQFSTPEPAYHGLVYTDAFGPAAYIGRARTVALRNTGSAISPFNAWQIIQGVQTLPLRMERHVTNAQTVAEYLDGHDAVEWVRYGGLASDPNHKMALKYTGGTPSALMSFGIRGGFDAGVKFHDALEVFTRLVNIGDTRSLVTHPASTTHRQLEGEELVAAGVTPDMIRLCVGIEHIDDLLADIEQALSAAG